MLPFETLLCLGLGSFVGYFVLGLSGFGAGLLVICFWSVCTSLGINAGSLQLVIGADAISNMLVTIPFPFITKACIHGDYGIFAPIILFRNFANYAGAFLFHSLNEQLLELILGPILIFLVVLKYVPKFVSDVRKKFLQKKEILNLNKDVEMQGLIKDSDLKSTSQPPFSSDEKHPKIQSIGSLNCKNYSREEERQNQDEDEISLENEEVVHVLGYSESDKKIDDQTTTSCCFDLNSMVSSCVLSHLQIFYCILTCRFKISKESSSKNEYTKFIQFIMINSSEKNGCNENRNNSTQCDDNNHSKQKQNVNNNENILSENNKYIENDQVENESNNEDNQNQKGQLADQNDYINANDFNYVNIIYSQKCLKSVPILIIASLCSGIMGGMVGIPGPPLMYAFQFLELPKNVARSNASVANSFNFRALFYLLFGSIQFEYWYLYVCMVCCAISGLTVGSICQQYLSTKAYHHVLMGLVTLTGIIMLLRGTGVWIN